MATKKKEPIRGLKWERIDEDSARAPVPGGWVLVLNDMGKGDDIALFIPDPDHEWLLE